MDIIKEFQKYPKAWNAFLEWADNSSGAYYWRAYNLKLSGREERYLLADMQAWLDSVAGKEDRLQEMYKDVKKGLEIFENTKQ